MKTCNKCNQTKPLSEFYKQANCKDGRRPDCIECRKIYYHKHYKTPEMIDNKRVYDRKRYEEKRDERIACATAWKKTDKGKQAVYRYVRNKRKRDPEQSVARQAVKRAVAKGILPHISTMLCDICNEPAKHYHHYNGYNKENQLDVIPVCIACHNKIHDNVRK